MGTASYQLLCFAFYPDFVQSVLDEDNPDVVGMNSIDRGMADLAS